MKTKFLNHIIGNLLILDQIIKNQIKEFLIFYMYLYSQIFYIRKLILKRTYSIF